MDNKTAPFEMVIIVKVMLGTYLSVNIYVKYFDIIVLSQKELIFKCIIRKLYVSQQY